MLVLDTPFRPNALLVMSIDVGSSDDDINALSVKGVTAESAAGSSFCFRVDRRRSSFRVPFTPSRRAEPFLSFKL